MKHRKCIKDRFHNPKNGEELRIVKHKPHLFEEQNNAGGLEIDASGNVVKIEGTNAKRKSSFKSYFQRKQKEIKAIDPIWIEWIEEAIHIIVRDSLKSLRNLAIIGTIIAIMAQFV